MSLMLGLASAVLLPFSPISRYSAGDLPSIYNFKQTAQTLDKTTNDKSGELVVSKTVYYRSFSDKSKIGILRVRVSFNSGSFLYDNDTGKHYDRDAYLSSGKLEIGVSRTKISETEYGGVVSYMNHLPKSDTTTYQSTHTSSFGGKVGFSTSSESGLGLQSNGNGSIGLKQGTGFYAELSWSSGLSETYSRIDPYLTSGINVRSNNGHNAVTSIYSFNSQLGKLTTSYMIDATYYFEISDIYITDYFDYWVYVEGTFRNDGVFWGIGSYQKTISFGANRWVNHITRFEND